MKKLHVALMALAIISTPLAYATGSNHHNGGQTNIDQTLDVTATANATAVNLTNVEVGVENTNVNLNHIGVTVNPEISQGQMQILDNSGSNLIADSANNTNTITLEEGMIENTVSNDTNVDTGGTVVMENVGNSESVSSSSADNSLSEVGNVTESGNSDVVVTISNPRQIPSYNPQPVNLSYIAPGEQVRLPAMAGWDVYNMFFDTFYSLSNVEFTVNRFQKIVIGDKDDGEFEMTFIPMQKDIVDFQSSSNDPSENCSGLGKNAVCSYDDSSTTEKVSIQRIKPVLTGKVQYKPLGILAANCGVGCSMPAEIRLLTHAGVHSVLPPRYKEVRFLYIPSTQVSASGLSGDSYNVGGSGAASKLGSMALNALGISGGFGESNSMPVMGPQGFQAYVFEEVTSGGIAIDFATFFEPLAKKEAKEVVAKVESPQPVNVTVNIQQPEVAEKEAEEPVKVVTKKDFVPTMQPKTFKKVTVECSSVCKK